IRPSQVRRHDRPWPRVHANRRIAIRRGLMEHRRLKGGEIRMPKFRTLDDLSVTGKRVLVRCDLNVPMKDGKVTDATRIERSADTLKQLSAKGAKVIVLSHFGRPKGKRAPEFSQRPLVEPLAKALGRSVAFAEDCVGPAAEQAVKALKDGDVLL